MKRFSIAIAALFCFVLADGSAVAEDSYSVKVVEALPEGTPQAIADSLSSRGVSVVGEEGVVCSVWFGKSLATKSGFSPNFTVKYPFTPGQLIGLLHVVQESQYTDFRGQEVAPGLYTLRYGLQPQDGNHLGTSVVRDFVLALPAKADQNAKPVSDEAELLEKSAEAAQSTHPAIFALQGIEKTPEQPALEYDDTKEFWILKTTAGVARDDKTESMPIQMVVIGHAEG